MQQKQFFAMESDRLLHHVVFAAVVFVLKILQIVALVCIIE